MLKIDSLTQLSTQTAIPITLTVMMKTSFLEKETSKSYQKN